MPLTNPASGHRPPARTQRGFTMIEVLVSLLVLGVGVLGVVSLQAVAARSAYNSQLLTVAVQQAQAMAERMRANPVGVREGGYDAIDGLEADPGCLPGCSPLEMAAFDGFSWGRRTRRLLHGLDEAGQDRGTVKTTVTGNGDGTFTIRVQWNDLVEGAAEASSYQLRIRP